MSTTAQKDSCIVFNTATFQEKVQGLIVPYSKRFFRLNRSYVFFHTFFIFVVSLELIFFGLFFPEFVQSTLMAFCLAGIFLTIFTYLVLLFYLQGRRSEKLMQLRDEYIESARSCIPFALETLEYHCCITEAIVQFISKLGILSVKNKCILASETFTYIVEKFRIWTKWKDLLKLKEMLLFSSIQEHIRLIKREPLDLEAHASLASNYLALARLYEDPHKLALNDQLCWTPPEYNCEEMRKKYEAALERALEEYHIMDEYAFSDPWVHAQKAAIYNELGKPEDEKREYEKILEIDEQNTEILVRLGRLYFSQGENAKGLKIYDQLNRIDINKAISLINYYDAYHIKEYSFEK